MSTLLVTEDRQLTIPPSPGSSAHDFDFYTGRWRIHNRKLQARLCGCTEWIEFEAEQEMQLLLNGQGNIDFFHALDGGGFEGMTLRLFNPATRLWSIYWADSTRVILDPPVTGSFENGIGTFYGWDECNGQTVLVKFCWDARQPDSPTWSQAFSTDQGQTWEWNWYMYMTRR